MAIPYRQLAREVLEQLSSQIDTLDEDQAKHFAKQISAFYQFVVYQKTIPQPPEEDDNSLYVITMGVLMNHFMKNESPQIPQYSFQNGQ